MEKIVEAAEKKVKTANQIVKYLQLELENYKDTYDIFGPGGEQEEDLTSTKKLRVSTNITEEVKVD